MTQKGMPRNSWNIFYVCKILSILFFSVIFLSLPLSAEELVITKTTGAAVASFGATSASALSVCASAISSDSILVQNQGTLHDTYTLAIDAEEDVASWLTLSDTKVALQPGEEKEVLVYSRPAAEGTFSYKVEIASLYGSVKEVEKTITVSSCQNIALTTYTPAQETCPCSTGAYVFELENTGGFTETYFLELTGINPDYYDLSEYAVTLSPGEEKDIYAYVRMACFVWGSFDFTLHAETEASGYTAEIPLSLEIPQACYNYDIALGEAVLFEENETMDISFAEAEDTSYELCQETPAVIPVQIKNPAEVKNTYTLAIEDAEEWIVPATPAIQISGEEEELTYIVVNTAAAEPGNYSFALKADSSRGALEAVLPFTVAVETCEEKEMSAWLKYLLAGILALILLAILLALFMLWQRRKGTAGKKASSMHLQKAQKAAANFWQKHRKFLSILLPLLLLFFIIGALAYPIVKEKYAEALASGAASSSTQQATVAPLFYNWATALIILGIFLLLFLLLWYFKFRKKAKKNIWEKIKPVLKWLWIILLLLVLLSALAAGMYFLYKNYKEDAQKYLTEQNATGSENATVSETEETAETETTAEETEEETQLSSEEAAALQKQLTDIQEQLTEKEKQIAALDEQLMNLTEQVAQEETLSPEEETAFDSRIAALQEQIAALEKQVKELEEKEKELLEKLGLLDEKVAALEENVSDLEERIAALEERIAALEDLVDQLRKEQEQAETEEVIEKVEEEIADLEEEKQALEETETTEPLVLEEVLEITDDSFETMLLFDASLSSQIVEGGISRFEKGLAAAAYYVQEKGQYSVMVVGKNAIVVRRKVNSETVLRTIKYLRPLDTQSNLGNALYAAGRALGSSGRIVLISDMQTTDGKDIIKIKGELEQQGLDVIFVDVAQQKSTSESEEVKEEAEEVSEEVEKTAEEGPVFDVESQTAGNFFIEIPKNTKYIIDLNKYFLDEDNDLLQYGAEPGEHISAVIDNNKVTMIPETDWTGETSIVFSADDGKGGKVESPAIKVMVKEVEAAAEITTTEETAAEEAGEEEASEAESSEEEQASPLSQYVPWIILGSIISLILISLVMGAFARKFHKDPEVPENKEEAEEKKKEE